ncbi:MAG: cation diffusion facilitator family transporter [Anaerolineaceae bacterium]|nr:cation diffusion facilitator family transporter [Anaerolineaceae bacterium]
MRWVRDYQPQQEQNRLYRNAIIITLGGNLLLAAAKGIVAAISGSAAIYADAANSISDVVYSLLMVLGLWMAMQPPDLSHPQGHSRFEPVVGLLVTLSMAFAGYEAARNAHERYLTGGESIALGLPIIILLSSALLKAGMFVVIRRIAKQLSSPTLKTTAKDNLSDVLATMAAFIGVLGTNFIHPLADPIAGFVVALWILRQAFLAGKENLGFLTGKSASAEDVKTFIAAAEEIPGVLRVHHIMTDYVGPRLMLDLHINVEGSKTLIEVHEITDRVIKRLEEFSEVDRAYVHVEPDDWVD